MQQNYESLDLYVRTPHFILPSSLQFLLLFFHLLGLPLLLKRVKERVDVPNCSIHMGYLRSLDNQRTLSTDFESGPKSVRFMIIFFYYSFKYTSDLLSDKLHHCVSLVHIELPCKPWQFSWSSGPMAAQ